MDDPNITMEEYIRLEEEKAQKHGKVFNWEAARYGKIWYDEDVHGLISVETEFPAIVFNDNLTSNETLSYEPTIIFDKNSFSYKIISTNDLKTGLENDNEKVNVPLFPSPEPTVTCIDDLDFFKDFEKEFPAILYNDALTSKSDFSTKPTLCRQHIDEFDLKDETSLFKYDEVERNVLYFNDLFPFNIIHPDNLKSDKGNDDIENDMIQSSGGIENTQGLNKLLERSHDKISKVFKIKSFVMELNENIMAWNHLVNGMLFNLIKNLYVPFGIPFDPKWYYKDGDCTRMLRRPGYEGLQYTNVDIADFETRLARIYRKEVHRVLAFDFGGLPDLMAEMLSTRMLIEHMDAQRQSVFISQAWRRLFDIKGPLVHELILEFFNTFREFILDLGLHSTEEMQTAGFGLYWTKSARRIPDKGDLRDYWIGISSAGDFLGTAPSYTFIMDPMVRLCHRLITYSIVGRIQAPKKVTMTNLFYLRGMDIGSVNVPYLLARYLRLFASRRKQGAMISGGQYLDHLAEHFGLMTEERLQGPTRQEEDAGGVAEEAPVALGGGDEDEEMPQAMPPPPRTQGERIA
ncbi:hypothetical protein Tco_1187251 [Tanacetum coccineum]